LTIFSLSSVQRLQIKHFCLFWSARVRAKYKCTLEGIHFSYEHYQRMTVTAICSAVGWMKWIPRYIHIIHEP
jgi:hypothetical protein